MNARLRTAGLLLIFGGLVHVAAYSGEATPAAKVAQQATKFPAVTLDNGEVKVTVFTPDPAKGYYRGARFDWAGIVGQGLFIGLTGEVVIAGHAGIRRMTHPSQCPSTK